MLYRELNFKQKPYSITPVNWACGGGGGGGGGASFNSTSSVYNAGGVGSAAGNRIVWFTAVKTAVGADLTYTSDAVNGDKWTINTTGGYSINSSIQNSIGGNGASFGYSLNQADLTKAIFQVSKAEQIDNATTTAVLNAQPFSWSGRLVATSIVRLVMGSAIDIGDDLVFLEITRIY